MATTTATSKAFAQVTQISPHHKSQQAPEPKQNSHLEDQTHRTKQAYEKLEAAFTARNPKSKAIHDRALDSLPGGNTRSVLYYAPFPLSITHASGSALTSADGNTYIDLLGEYTAALYGHSNPIITSTLTSTISKGLNFGSHGENEGHLASLIKERFPSIELLRFTNSGTEATLMALAAAKIHTGKSKILVFGNAYHGGAFSFAGGVSSPVNAPHEYLIAEYKNLPSVRELVKLDENKNDIAAIIVEPMMGSGGCIPGESSFLRGLRTIANETGAILIYDEVMTSRMHNGGGIQSQFDEDMRPDLTTLGKYIGGGMSFGAFGGKSSIMSIFDPRRPDSIKHAGTFNNNVLTMAAGRAGLEQIFTASRAEELHARGDMLRSRLQNIAPDSLMQVTGYGSIMCFHFCRTPSHAIKSHKDLAGANSTLSDLLHLFLLERGYYIARRGFIALNLALSDVEMDGFVKAVAAFASEYNSLLSL